jgi:hypothetical protein
MSAFFLIVTSQVIIGLLIFGILLLQAAAAWNLKSRQRNN